MVMIRHAENRSDDEETRRHTRDDPRNDNRAGEESRPQQQNSNNSGSTPNRKDNFAIFLKIVMEMWKTLDQRIKRVVHFILNDLGGNQILDSLTQWCVQHPQMTICLLAAGLVISLPILLFIAFALSTILMTFTGFLVLEGTLLTILTMMLVGLLGALGIILLFFALVGVTTYFGVSRVYDMYGSTETQRTNLRNMMRENQNFDPSTTTATNI